MERSKYKKVEHPRRGDIPSSITSTIIHYIIIKCLILNRKIKKKKINDLRIEDRMYFQYTKIDHIKI